MDLSLPVDQGAQTLSTAISNALRTAIANGEFAPGGKLRLDELRASFGVSLSPLREALSRLAAEGFVHMEDQRGWRVAPVSERDLVEVTKLRSVVEPFALRESIGHGDESWESAVVASRHRLGKLEQAAAPAQQQVWETAHRSFHDSLICGCRMPLLLHFSATLQDLSSRYRRLFLSAWPLDRGVHGEHGAICDAALDRDADRACRLLREHIERTGDNIRQAVASRKAAPYNRAQATDRP